MNTDVIEISTFNSQKDLESNILFTYESAVKPLFNEVIVEYRKLPNQSYFVHYTVVKEPLNGKYYIIGE